jgi:hypothetical protein
MLAADRRAINRLFCFALRTRRELEKIDFDIHAASLCLDGNLVNSELVVCTDCGRARFGARLSDPVPARHSSCTVTFDLMRADVVQRQFDDGRGLVARVRLDQWSAIPDRAGNRAKVGSDLVGTAKAQ